MQSQRLHLSQLTQEHHTMSTAWTPSFSPFAKSLRHGLGVLPSDDEPRFSRGPKSKGEQNVLVHNIVDKIIHFHNSVMWD